MSKQSFLCCLLSLMVITEPLEARESTWDTIKEVGAWVAGGAIIGGIAAGIYTLVRPKTPQEVLESTKVIYWGYVKKHTELIEMVESYCGFSAAKLHEEVIHADEGLLYKIATTYHTPFGPTKSDLEELSYARYEIARVLTQVHDTQERQEFMVWQRYCDELYWKLSGLRTYLCNNESYFKLFEIECRLVSYHAAELAVYDQYASSSFILLQNELATTIAIHAATQRWGAFPLATYLDLVVQDIEQLDAALRRLSYAYRQRAAYARALCTRLECIRKAVASDPRYQDALRAREQARHEEQRIEIERQRVAIEAERLRVERERVRAEEERARAERDRARAERERAERERVQIITVCTSHHTKCHCRGYELPCCCHHHDH